MDIIGNKAVDYTVYKYENRKDWLFARKGHIGASDAAAVVGLSPWMTNVQLYEDKTSPFDVKEIKSAMIERGVRSEPHIRELYAIESGDTVQDGTGKLLVSKDSPFMSCTLDGACLDDDGNPYILEIKSVNWSRHWAKDNGIPDHYFIQLLHQLYVTGWDRAVLLARIIMPGGNEVVTREYVVNYADTLLMMEGLVGKEREFWAHVTTKTPPSLIVSLPTI